MSSFFVLSSGDRAQPPGPFPHLHSPHSQEPDEPGQPGEGDGAEGSPEAQTQALQAAPHQHVRFRGQPTHPADGGQRRGGAHQGRTQGGGGGGGRGGKGHWQH